MKITIEETKHIAKLSRLDFTIDELELLRGQLDSILHFIDKLNELDTSGVEPTSHVLNMSNVTREDIRGDSLATEDTLRNAPDVQEFFFRVPKIIE